MILMCTDHVAFNFIIIIILFYCCCFNDTIIYSSINACIKCLSKRSAAEAWRSDVIFPPGFQLHNTKDCLQANLDCYNSIPFCLIAVLSYFILTYDAPFDHKNTKMASSGRTSPPPSTTPSSPPHASSRQIPPMALIIYPVTLLVGSLYSTISPTARGPQADPSSHQHPAPLAPSIATDVNLLSPPESPVNYFARKDNIFNIYYVKIGWLWLTLAFVSLLVSQPAYRSSSAGAKQPRRIAQAVLRYVLATAVWYLMTQWFFGPAVIDRSFVVTGGKCERVVAAVQGEDTSTAAGAAGQGLESMLTAAACKAAGGSWAGGHDVSGHVFMLVLVTAVLALEVMGVAGEEGLGRMLSCCCGGGAEDGGKEKQDGVSDYTKDDGVEDGLQVWTLRFVLGVAGLGWWMLFMTAIWFHTWLEKVSLSIHSLCLFALYGC